MTDETANTVPPTGAKTQNQRRDQSGIQFPYGDLDDAIAVANGIMSCGGTSCEGDQLAAALGQTPTSGSFRMKISTARQFGLIRTVQGRYQLTDLGFEVVDAVRSRDAKVKAFLTVPLYKRVYDEFRNRPLPPRPAALEQAFVGFGVIPKQKERARQAFDRSAQQAGFFDQGGRDRLIAPPSANLAVNTMDRNSNGQPFEGHQEESKQGDGGSANCGSGYRGHTGLHPFIQGLLDTLPEPTTNWTIEGRAKWLQAAANIFDLMYKGDGDITVQAAKKDQATGYEPVARNPLAAGDR